MLLVLRYAYLSKSFDHHLTSTLRNYLGAALHAIELKVEGAVREIGLYDTCWWYSLCNFQYRQQYENTCSYNVDC